MICRLLLSLLLVLILASPSWARIATGAAGAQATGTTSLAVPFPASIQFGDILVLSVINKYPTNGPTLPTDAFGGVWVAPTNGQASGGLGVDTTDTGHTYTTFFYKIATGTETGNLTVTIGSGNSAAGRMQSARNSTGLWSVAAANAAVDVALTAWSAACTCDPDITTSDLVYVVSAAYSDAPTFSAHALTQTGVNFGTVSEVFDAAITDGDDMRFVEAFATVVSGPSSAANLTYTATASIATGGSTVFLRVREAPSTPVAFSAIGTVGSGTVSAAPSFPATIVAGDLLVMCVANKYPTNGPAVPTDAFGGTWSAETNGQGTGGADPDGVDTGHTYATIFTKVATGTEDGSTASFSVTSGNAVTANITRYTNTSGRWITAAHNGADNVADASWSVTAGSDPGVTANDILFTCTAVASDDSRFTETTELITQTGITAWGLSAERYDLGTSNGEDVGLKVVDFVAIAGTSSAAPAYAATLTTTSAGGATAFLRIREDTSASIQGSSGFLGAIIQ